MSGVTPILPGGNTPHISYKGMCGASEEVWSLSGQELVVEFEILVSNWVLFWTKLWDMPYGTFNLKSGPENGKMFYSVRSELSKTILV